MYRLPQRAAIEHPAGSVSSGHVVDAAARRFRLQVLGPTVLADPGHQFELTVVEQSILAALVRDGECSHSRLRSLVWLRRGGIRELNLHVATLRGMLGDALTITSGGQLRIDRRRVWIDADDFARVAAGVSFGNYPARQIDIASARRALHLVSGEPFDVMRHHQAWTHYRREWITRVDQLHAAIVTSGLESSR